MRRFRFPLQTLLEVRSRWEELCEHRLAEAKRLAQAQEEIVEGLHLDLTKGREGLRRAVGEGAPIEEVLLHLEHLQRMEVHIARAEVHLMELRAKEEEARKDLMEARRARRVVERVRERRWTTYLQEAYREESKFLDEIAIAAKNRDQG